MAGIFILVLLGRGEAAPLGGSKELLHAENLLGVALDRKKCQLEESPPKKVVAGKIIIIQTTQENHFRRQSWGIKKKKKK